MIGTKLGDRYEVVSELGRGGMGVVYKATDPRLDREVAVKLIPPNLLTEDAERRFQSEAQTVAKMDHASICPIYDFGNHEGSLYFVMPVLRGKSLRAVLRDETMTLGAILDGGIQVAEALEYSHQNGVLHRDIKPENLMVSQEQDGQIRVRVMDFGLARDTSLTRFTKSGMLVGTMAYVSPEQVTGQPVDRRSDVYALGTVLYECIVHDLPFSGEMQSVLYRIVHELPQSPRMLGADIDDELDGILLGCLAKDPGARPQTAGALAESLRRYRSRLRDSDRDKTVMVSRSSIVHRPVPSPFVGRENEMRELQGRLNAAKAGECQFAVVSGEAGSGKTRLLDELENLVRAQELRVLRGRLMEQDGAFPYHGFCEVIQDYFRQREGSSAGGEALDFGDLAPELVALFPMLAEIPHFRAAGAESSGARAPGETRTPENRTQIFELLARTLTRLAGGRPLVLVLEDLHGAEDSIDALQYIVRRLGPTPTLIVGSFRSTEVDKRSPLSRMLRGFEGDRRFQSFVLGPLTPSEHKKLLGTLVGGQEVSETLAEQLYEGSEGNPFFAKELIRSLLDSGSMVQDDTGAWTLSRGGGITPEALPATIQQAVERRIGELPDEQREILSIAAVIGRSFDFTDLEKLVGDDDLDDVVDRLVQEGLIEEDRRSRSDVLTFTSGVVRDVLYGELSRRRRRSLHRKVARQVEKRHSGRLERVYPQLLYHYAEGDVPEKAVEFGLLQTRQALDAFSPDEALRSAKTSLEFLDEEWEGEPGTEGDARLLLASALEMSGDVSGALKETESAIGVFQKVGADKRAVETLVEAAQIAWRGRRTEDTRLWLERGLSAARSAQNDEALAELLSLGATLANLQADYTRANAYLEEAEKLRGATGEAAAATEEIPAGGRLAVGLINPIRFTDPSNLQYDEQVEVIANVFETLLTTDEEGRLVPQLCRSWQVLEEGQVFRLEIREGVTFHDGTPLTAETVKEGFKDSIRRKKGELRAAFSALSGVGPFIQRETDDVAGLVATGPLTLEIRLDEPLPVYPALLTEYDTAVARTGNETEHEVRTIGTGPFKLERQEEKRIVLARNARYWGTAPRLEEVEFRAGISGTEMAAALRSGELDLVRDLPADDLEEFQRNPNFRGRMVETPGNSTFFLLFNALNGPVAGNQELRKALADVLRIRDLIWNAKGRLAETAPGIIPPGLLGHDPGRRRRHRSDEDAKAAIAEAGLQTPIRLKAAVSPANQERQKAILQEVFRAWGELGVEVTIVTPSAEEYDAHSRNGEGIDVLAGGWMPDYQDPDAFTFHLFNSRSGFYRKFYSSPEADQLLEDARAESRPEVRTKLYGKFEDLLQETAAMIPLFHEVYYRMPGPTVRGAKLSSSPPYVNYAGIGKAAAAEIQKAPKAEHGGTIRVPLRSRSSGELDPRRLVAMMDAEIASNIFEPLTRAMDEARVVPWLAARFEVEEDGRRYRFWLRPGVRFHDGRRLNPRDVRFTFERLLQSESEYRWILSPIKGAPAVIQGETDTLSGLRIMSATEFTIELDKPFSFLPAVLSDVGLSIVPEGVDFNKDNWRGGLVGTGPFRVVRHVPGSRVELERNPNYWREGYPRSSELIFELETNREETVRRFQAGYFSLVDNLSSQQYEHLRRDPEFSDGYLETPALETTLIGLNVKRGPFSDLALRRQLADLLDPAAFVRVAVGAPPTPAGGLIPPGLLGHESKPARRAEEPGLETAMLTQPGTEITVTGTWPVSFVQMRKEFLDQLNELLPRIGIRLEQREQDHADVVGAIIRAEVDIGVTSWGADFPDAHSMVHNVLHSEEGFFGRMCGSKEIDSLLEQAQMETDPSARHGLYRKIEEIVERDVLVIPIYHPQRHMFFHPSVDGGNLSFSSPFVAYDRLRVR